ncbi:MAG: PASTA domain-containing protein [Endomicrobiia bacterium]
MADQIQQQRPKKSSAFWTAFFTSLFVSVITSTLMYKYGSSFLDKLFQKKVEVPNLVGLTLDHAKLLLSTKKLQILVQEEIYSEEIEQGKIAKQSPLAGSVVDEGTSVSIFLSKGKEKVVVPVLVSLKLEEAQSQILSIGLSIGSVKYELSKQIPEGKVISSEPPAGQEVPKGTPINLLVSQGMPKIATPMVVVPDLYGKTLPEASSILSSYGLVLGKINKTTNIEQEFDIILNQSPKAGSKVPKGSAISVTINSEAEE